MSTERTEILKTLDVVIEDLKTLRKCTSDLLEKLERKQ